MTRYKTEELEQLYRILHSDLHTDLHREYSEYFNNIDINIKTTDDNVKAIFNKLQHIKDRINVQTQDHSDLKAKLENLQDDIRSGAIIPTITNSDIKTIFNKNAVYGYSHKTKIKK